MSLETFKPMAYGPIGDAIIVAEPHTEADPVGIYAATLALWSGAINGLVTMDADRSVVVWTVLVGESALGCKGTALRVSSKMLEHSLPKFLTARVKGGVSSGPSLTQLLYDYREETKGGEDGTDTRVIIVDDEWRENLGRQNRCPTFASKLRLCWDGTTIRHTTTKVSMTVEKPRLGFHAHITPGEWAKYVKPTDAAGGSFNRLLPVRVEASKVLPYGHKEKCPEIKGLMEAYEWARRTPRRMSLSKDAGRRYDELRVQFLAKMHDMPSGLTCYVERTPEQIVRVAAALTATEQKTVIGRRAIDAAWAFVQYSMLSVERLVRDDPKHSAPSRAMKPLPELIREVLTRYEGEVPHSLMLRSLGIRATAASLRKALAGMDDVRVITGVTSGRGRPGVVYKWAQGATEPAPSPVVSAPDRVLPEAVGEPLLTGSWL